jgi:rRNA maturation protein Nop10
MQWRQPSLALPAHFSPEDRPIEFAIDFTRSWLLPEDRYNYRRVLERLLKGIVFETGSALPLPDAVPSNL